MIFKKNDTHYIYIQNIMLPCIIAGTVVSRKHTRSNKMKIKKTYSCNHQIAKFARARRRVIWALARAPDLHLIIHQLVTSSNNSLQKFHTFPTNFQLGHSNKDTWNVTVPGSLSRRPKKGQNVTFLSGYNSRTV